MRGRKRKRYSGSNRRQELKLALVGIFGAAIVAILTSIANPLAQKLIASKEEVKLSPPATGSESLYPFTEKGKIDFENKRSDDLYDTFVKHKGLDLAVAESTLRTILDLEKNSRIRSRIMGLLGWVLFKQDRLAEAASNLEKSHSLGNSDVRKLLIEIYRRILKEKVLNLKQHTHTKNPIVLDELVELAKKIEKLQHLMTFSATKSSRVSGLIGGDIDDDVIIVESINSLGKIPATAKQFNTMVASAFTKAFTNSDPSTFDEYRYECVGEDETRANNDECEGADGDCDPEGGPVIDLDYFADGSHTGYGCEYVGEGICDGEDDEVCDVLDNDCGGEPDVDDPDVDNDYARATMLSFGVNHYTQSSGFPSLKYAESDARHIADLFRKLGYNSIEVTGPHATRSNLLNKLRQEVVSSKATDNFVLFFSGHGILNKSGVRVLTLSSADSPGMQQSVALDEVTRLLSTHKGKVLILIDVCGSGNETTETIRSIRQIPYWSANGGQQRLSIIVAAEDGKIAVESPRLESGVFAYSLKEYLRNIVESNRSGFTNSVALNIPKLYKWTLSQTRILSYALHGVDQHPQIMGLGSNECQAGSCSFAR